MLALVRWLVVGLVAVVPGRAHGWYDATHRAVLEASGAPFSPCVAIVPDAIAHKLPREAHNHFSNLAGLAVSAADVRAEAARYDTWDLEGHLNGAVFAAFTKLQAMQAQGRRLDYEFGFLAHYLGDLCQPLHQSPHDAFNQAHHRRIDGLVDAMPDLVAQIRSRARALPPPSVADGDQVAAAIAAVATEARQADARLRAGHLDHDDALTLLARSASLLRALALALGLTVAP